VKSRRHRPWTELQDVSGQIVKRNRGCEPWERHGLEEHITVAGPVRIGTNTCGAKSGRVHGYTVTKIAPALCRAQDLHGLSGEVGFAQSLMSGKKEKPFVITGPPKVAPNE